jgi:hypothetical protein
VKKQSEYTAIEWANLYPEQRYAIQQAANDAALGRPAMPVRAADGRGVVYVDRASGKPIQAAPARRIGGLV